jgi:hypothetical protein
MSAVSVQISHSIKDMVRFISITIIPIFSTIFITGYNCAQFLKLGMKASLQHFLTNVTKNNKINRNTMEQLDKWDTLNRG